MIQFIQIRHQFGSNILFDGFSWHIKPNQKIALIGPNGAGKTTLFQMANGKLKPDEGEVVKAKDTEISLFQQIPEFNPDLTALDTVLCSNKLYSDYLAKKEIIDKRFETTDHDSEEFEKLLADQSHLEDFANMHDLHNLEIKAKKILTGLGFSEKDFSKKVGLFSPGYHHRLSLVIALLNPHNLLLLDEPTNHLDDASKEWLSDYLREAKISFVLVTHDPEFLNSTAEVIAEISLKGCTEFTGTLEEFLEEKNVIHERLKNQYKKEEAYLKKRMDWIDRFRAKATKAKQAQSALKKLEKREKIENPEDIFWNKEPDYKFNFISDGKISFRLENATFQYESAGKMIFKDAKMEISSGDKVALVGPNGAGKSTFMRCVLGKHTLNSGSIYYGPKTKIAYFSQTHGDDLNPDLNMMQTILKYYPDMSDESIRKILGHFSFSGDIVFKKVSSMSGGEQSRLRLALMVLTPSNSLFMDEPTNHLDIVIRGALKRSLADFPGSLLIISHDPDFLNGLCNRTFELIGGELKDLNCSFSDYLKYHKEGTYSEEKEKSGKQENKDQWSARNNEKNRIKKVQREIEEIEAKISKAEENKSRLEKLIASPDFYQNNNYHTELEKYEHTKSEISSLMEKWEKLSEELGV